MPSSTLESAVRVFWISERSGVLEVELLGRWTSSLLSMDLISGCEVNACSAGFTIASLSGGLRVMMELRRVSKDFSTVGKLDMVVVGDQGASPDGPHCAPALT